MSLTHLIAHPALRSLFSRTAIGVPRGAIAGGTIQPDNPAIASRVGTAADYMIRVLLARHGRSSDTPIWSNPHVAWMAHRRASDKDGMARFAGYLEHQIRHSESVFAEVVAGSPRGGLRADFVRACCVMAGIDAGARAGLRYCRNVHVVATEVLSEVDDILETLDVGATFKPEDRILLNPSFVHSENIGGADADVLVDDTLWEIKTTRSGAIHRGYFEQLAGYAALACIGGFVGDRKGENVIVTGHAIRNFGVYFVRQKTPLVIPISELFGMFGWGEYVRGFEAVFHGVVTGERRRA